MKLTFKNIDKKLGGVLTHILRDAESFAADGGFSDGYGFGKDKISRLVGWYASDEFPELKTVEAYDVVLEVLAEACWRGDDACNARRHRDRELEKQGIFTAERAEEMACIKDALAGCTPQKCMGWRRTDDAHGFCVLLGCSEVPA